ncbi:MAG TPA: hypothetical protein VF157_09770, partial [Chloroflexota bacterium]
SVTFPAGTLGAAPGPVTVKIRAASGLGIPGGPMQYSPNGSLLDISIVDANGNPITVFPNGLIFTVKFNGADLTMAHGNPALLTVAYIIDALSPAPENPMHFPDGTFVLFPTSSVKLDAGAGTLTVTTNFLGSTVAVITNPVGYVETLGADTPLLSSFDPATSTTFGTRPQSTTMQVVEPQVGSRLVVLDPDTGNYAYVNATDVGPSGPPASKSSSAVVRGLLPIDTRRLAGGR